MMVVMLLAVLGLAPVQAVRTTVATNYPGQPPICDEELVSQICMALEPSSNGQISKGSLKQSVSATLASVETAWEVLDFKDDSVECKWLCDNIAGYFQSLQMLPPRSNVGCIGSGKTLQCEVDLSTPGKAGFDLPDFHDKETGIGGEEALTKDPQEDSQELSQQLKDPDQLTVVPVLPEKEISYNKAAMLRRMANLFSFYPPLPTTFDDRTDLLRASYKGGAIPKSKEMMARRSTKLTMRRTVSTRSWGFKLKIKKGLGFVVLRVEPGSVAAKAGLHEHDVILSVNDLHFSTFYTPSTDSHIDNTKFRPELIGMTLTFEISEDEEHEVGHVADQSMPLWLEQVNERALQAQKYIDTAIVRSNSQDSLESMDTWFGEDAATNPDKRREIKRIMNSVSEMLGNVKYIFPGKQCEDNTYAYVFPRGEKAKTQDGQYIFILCPLYVKSSPSVQIETLIHEASHHAIAYTDDVCADDIWNGGRQPTMITMPLSKFNGVFDSSPSELIDMQFIIKEQEAVVRYVTSSEVTLEVDTPYDECNHKAYGRTTCSALAGGSHEQQIKALRNADNFCYFVQDVTDGVRPTDFGS